MKWQHAGMILASAAFAAVQIPLANAASIGVSFTDNGDQGVQSGEMQPGDLAGAPGVRVGNWNNWINRDSESTGQHVTGAVLGDDETVLFDDGSTVGGGFQVGLTLVDAAFTDRDSGAHANDAEMYNGVVDQRTDNPTLVAVTNVPFAQYDVYAYMRDDGAARAGSYAIDDTTYYLRGGAGIPADDGTGYVLSTDTTNTGLGQASVDQGNYVKFSGLTGSSFTLEVGTFALSGGDGVTRNKFAGFQIVNVIPEPASFVLLGLGSGIALAVIRRKQA